MQNGERCKRLFREDAGKEVASKKAGVGVIRPVEYLMGPDYGSSGKVLNGK
jgi:hypothetical protein